MPEGVGYGPEAAPDPAQMQATPEKVNIGQSVTMAREMARPGQGKAMGDDVPATEAEQQEYEDAVEIVATSLYEGKPSQAIQKMLQQGNDKIASVGKASSMALKLLDGQHDFDEAIIAELTQEITARVIEMHENMTQEEFTPEQAQGALAMSWELVMNMYGVDADEYAELTDGMEEGDLKDAENQYNSLLKGAYPDG